MANIAKSRKPVDGVTTMRIVETSEMILNLKSRRYIIDFLVTKYGIQPRSCDKIISQANQHISDNFRTDRNSIIAKHLQVYYDIAADCKLVDPKSSLKALEQIEKLLKLHQDVPLIQHNTMQLSLDNVTDEQLIKAIENIKTIKKDV